MSSHIDDAHISMFSNLYTARALINETRLNHRKNPSATWEMAFMYTIANSRGFGRLPMECIMYARENLGLNRGCTVETKTEPDVYEPSNTIVHAEHVLVDGEQMIKILEITDVHYLSALPNAYREGEYPQFFAFHNSPHIGILIQTPDTKDIRSFIICSGNIMSIEDFDQMIKTMKEASLRLTKINKKIKSKKEHSGEFTVEI